MSKVLESISVQPTLMSIIEGGQPSIGKQEGARTTPSIVAVSKSGERLVGQPAKRHDNIKTLCHSIKRLIGRNWNV